MTVEPAWDDFLKSIIFDAEMTPKPASAFFMRFGCKGASLFEDGTVDSALAKLEPNDPNAIENYQSRLKQALRCLNQKFPECGRSSKRDRTEEVMRWLRLQYPTWLTRVAPVPAEASIAQNVNHLLKQLDYVKQSSQFRTVIDQNQFTGIFLVRASDSLIQRWSAYRLLSLIPGYETAEHHSFQVNLSWKNALVPFWRSLSAKLKVQTSEPESVMEMLLQRCQTQVVTLTFYGVNRCDQMLLEPLSELLRRMQPIHSTEQSWQGGGLIILLVDSDRYSPSRECLAMVGQHFNQLDHLAQLSLSDIQKWIRYETVQQFLQDLHGDEMNAKLSYLIPSDGQRSHEPREVVEDICDTCGLEHGVAEIEAYWELAG